MRRGRPTPGRRPRTRPARPKESREPRNGYPPAAGAGRARWAPAGTRLRPRASSRASSRRGATGPQRRTAISLPRAGRGGSCAKARRSRCSAAGTSVGRAAPTGDGRPGSGEPGRRPPVAISRRVASGHFLIQPLTSVPLGACSSIPDRAAPGPGGRPHRDLEPRELDIRGHVPAPGRITEAAGAPDDREVDVDDDHLRDALGRGREPNRCSRSRPDHGRPRP